MKTAVYSVTRNKISDTVLYKSIYPLDKTFDFYCTEDNTTGLSKKYNLFLSTKGKEYDYVIFVHDDVFLDDKRMVEKLLRAHKAYDIVGLAGGLNPKLTQPALWHLMCGGFSGGNLRGAVAHPCSKEQLMVTNFGPSPDRVTILDGLFLSVDVRRVNSVGWKFNENYDFHHYDIASCIDANKKQLKLGVAPLWVVHTSPGLLDINDEKFVTSQQKFLLEYSSNK